MRFDYFDYYFGQTKGTAFKSGPRLCPNCTLRVFEFDTVEDLPFSRYGSLPLTDHGDDSVCAHIQGDVPEQRVAGCRRSKGHTFLDCRSARKSQSERSRMW